MLIAALIVGLITAYYFGLRTAGMAVIAAILLMVAGMVNPRMAVWVYLILGSGVAAIVFLGPKLAPKLENSPANSRAVRVARAGLSQIWKRIRDLKR